jgi:hypothetical protein
MAHSTLAGEVTSTRTTTTQDAPGPRRAVSRPVISPHPFPAARVANARPCGCNTHGRGAGTAAHISCASDAFHRVASDVHIPTPRRPICFVAAIFTLSVSMSSYHTCSAGARPGLIDRLRSEARRQPSSQPASHPSGSQAARQVGGHAARQPGSQAHKMYLMQPSSPVLPHEVLRVIRRRAELNCLGRVRHQLVHFSYARPSVHAHPTPVASVWGVAVVGITRQDALLRKQPIIWTHFPRFVPGLCWQMIVLHREILGGTFVSHRLWFRDDALARHGTCRIADKILRKKRCRSKLGTESHAR